MQYVSSLFWPIVPDEKAFKQINLPFSIMSLYLCDDYIEALLGMMQIYCKPHIDEFALKLQIPNFERRYVLFY